MPFRESRAVLRRASSGERRKPPQGQPSASGGGAHLQRGGDRRVYGGCDQRVAACLAMAGHAPAARQLDALAFSSPTAVEGMRDA